MNARAEYLDLKTEKDRFAYFWREAQDLSGPGSSGARAGRLTVDKLRQRYAGPGSVMADAASR